MVMKMEVLVKQNITLTEKDFKTNLYVPFRVPKAFKYLIIKFQYAPHQVLDLDIWREEVTKCLHRYLPKDLWPAEPIDLAQYDPIFNFVTLSLDFGECYIGCAHRHVPDLIVKISENEASWGFEPTPVDSGDWRVGLHVHSVVQGPIQCTLCVWGSEKADDKIPAF